jgi:hypothetical protein
VTKKNAHRPALSSAAERFLRESVGSVLHLDVLLLLHDDAGRWWSADQIRQVRRMSAESVATVLEELAALNLLDVRLGSCVSFRFAPLDPAIAAAASEISPVQRTAPEVLLALLPICQPARRPR